MDSAIHARAALEIASSGLVPKLPAPDFNLDSGLPFFNDQPFPFFWLTGLFMHTFGANAWGARFLASAFAVAAVLLLFFYLRRYFSGLAAWVGAFIFMINPLWIRFAARFQLDPPMIFFILASFYAWTAFLSSAPKKLRYSILAGALAGLAVSTKSPVGLLLFPSALTTELITQKGFRKRVLMGISAAILSALIIIVTTWITANHLGGANLFADYLNRQVLGTAVGGRGMIQERDFLSGIKVLGRFCKLEILIVLTVLIVWIRKKKVYLKGSENLVLLITGFIIVMFVISALRFKFPHYFLPAFPFAGAILGIAISSLSPKGDQWEEASQSYAMLLASLTMVVFLIFPIQTAPEQFVALRRFVPFIQTHGTKEDRLLFINHLQPYGSEGDYFCEVIFYTRKRFMTANCENANQRAMKDSPEWILTSGRHPSEACLSAETLSHYPTHLSFGNQILLSKYPFGNKDTRFDLSPLVNELSASPDGNPIAYKKGMYFTPKE